MATLLLPDIFDIHFKEFKNKFYYKIIFPLIVIYNSVTYIKTPKRLDWLDVRIERVTGLDSNKWAEPLQTTVYGMAGHYAPHYDHVRNQCNYKNCRNFDYTFSITLYLSAKYQIDSVKCQIVCVGTLLTV